MNRKILFILASMISLAALSLTYLDTTFGAKIDGWDEDVEMEEKGKVDMQPESLDHDILKISVMSIDMTTPVLGLAFHLNYDADKIKFLKYEPGDFLEQGGDPFYLVQNDEKKKQIIFGETLRRDDKFPKGGGKIADIYFQIKKRDAMEFKFSNGVVSTLDTVRQDIDKIVWNDLSLDKDGKKMSDDSVNGDIVGNQKIQTDTVNLPENFEIILAMGIVILGLLLWIYLSNRRKKFQRF